MCFISPYNLFSFTIHTANIIFISMIEFIHFSDKVISFVTKSPQILLQSSLLSLGILSPQPHLIKLVIEVSQSIAVLLMLLFKFSKFIIFPHQIVVYLTSFFCNFFPRTFLIAKFGQHIIFLSLKPVKLISQFIIKLSFVSQIFLEIPIDNIFD